MRKCIYCGNVPHVLDMGGLFYVQCKCGNFNPYQFCGLRKKYAMDQWDYANTLAAKINMEHTREANRRGAFCYIVAGKRYDTVSGAAKAAGCAIKTIQAKFGALSNTAIIRGHVVTRVRREHRRVAK